MSAIFLQGENPKSKLEENFAEYVGFESAIICQSGWVANIGLMQAIASKDVPVYIDFSAHMSLWEGIKAAEARAVPFLHNDIENCEQKIKQHGTGIIVVDSVYSSSGSVCLLEEIAELAKKYGCMLVVDESHSLGTHGKHGAGLVHELGLEAQVDFITASLAKTFAGRAGLIACSKEFAGYFPFEANPAIFSSAMLPNELAGLSTTLEVIKKADNRREQLFYNSQYLRTGLNKMGYNVGEGNSQIIALESGTEPNTEILRDVLEDHDVFGSVFCRPATAKNKSLMRFSVSSGLKKEELDHILSVCREIRNDIGMWDWRSTKQKAKKELKKNDGHSMKVVHQLEAARNCFC